MLLAKVHFLPVLDIIICMFDFTITDKQVMFSVLDVEIVLHKEVGRAALIECDVPMTIFSILHVLGVK